MAFLKNIDSGKKDLFLALCYQAIICNNELAQEEINTIYAYADEIDSSMDLEGLKMIPLERIVFEIKTMSFVEKKIILSEVLGLLLSDGVYDDIERTFFYDIASRIGLETEMVELIEKNVIDYTAAYERFCKTILAE